MNTISAKIKQFFSKNRNNILFVVLFVGLLYIDNVFAADGDKINSGVTGGQTTEQDPTKIILWLSGFLNIVGAGLGIMTGFVMKFLQPGWTSGSVLGLNDILKNIWVMISNIVYFVFAFLLIAIAFMNIIGKGENNYQMKTALPKLIVGIIIVPFTWFIVQFIVSLSTIFTASMISLPYDIFNGSDKQSILSKINLPTDCTIDLTSSGGTKCEGTGKALSEVLSGKDSIGGIIGFYSYGLINIDEITKLKSRNVGRIKTIFDLGLKAIVDLIFIGAYLILLRAIAMVLFTRGIYLWLYAMFSPIFGLMYFFGKSIPAGMKKLEILTIPKLIGLAFVPVYVAAALSFGFIFLISAGHSLSGIVSDTYSTDTSKSTSTGEGSDIAGIKFKIIGGSSSTDTNAALSVLTNTKDGAKNLVGQFIMQLFGIAILWMVVMAALQSSEITKSIVEPIAQFGGSIGKTITSLPKYAPIFPGGMSAESMAQAGRMPQSILDQRVNDKSNLFRDKYFRGNGKDVADLNMDIKNMDTQNEVTNVVKKWKEAINKYGRDSNQVKEIETNLKEQLKNTRSVDNYLGGADTQRAKEGKMTDEDLAKIIYKGGTNDKATNDEIKDFIGGKMNNKGEHFKDIKEAKTPETPKTSLPSGITKDDKKSDQNNVVFNITNNGATNPITVKTDGTTNSTDTINALKGTEFGKKYTIDEFEKNIIDPMGIKGQTKLEIITGLNKNGFFSDGNK